MVSCPRPEGKGERLGWIVSTSFDKLARHISRSFWSLSLKLPETEHFGTGMADKFLDQIVLYAVWEGSGKKTGFSTLASILCISQSQASSH
jgi:hypothetical protein